MNELSVHQRIKNAAASQEIEKIKATHSYLHGRADGASEMANLWSKSKNCVWAHTFGRMRGFDQVWFGYVTKYDKMSMENWLGMHEKYPEVGGKDPRPLMECSVHTLATDIIEVAADGMSGRGAFITPGVIHSRLTPGGERFCNVMWERYGADFVFEDGKWVYLHEAVCPDILSKMDAVNWAHDEFARVTDPNPEPPPPATLGELPPLTDPGPLHLPYSVTGSPQDTAPCPEPYETLDNENTFAPLLD